MKSASLITLSFVNYNLYSVPQPIDNRLNPPGYILYGLSTAGTKENIIYHTIYSTKRRRIKLPFTQTYFQPQSIIFFTFVRNKILTSSKYLKDFLHIVIFHVVISTEQDTKRKGEINL